MSSPAVLGANILSLVDAVREGIDMQYMPAYLIGTAVAMVSGIGAISLLKYISKKQQIRRLCVLLLGRGRADDSPLDDILTGKEPIMAQTKGKKEYINKTKTQTKAKKTPEKDNTPPPAPPAPPIRREAGAFVFLFLAVFTAVGMFNTDGAFISFLRTV